MACCQRGDIRLSKTLQKRAQKLIKSYENTLYGLPYIYYCTTCLQCLLQPSLPLSTSVTTIGDEVAGYCEASELRQLQVAWAAPHVPLEVLSKAGLQQGWRPGPAAMLLNPAFLRNC